MRKTNFLIILIYFTGSCWGQCNGPPLILMPNNSTGNLAFPEANLDTMTGTWHGDHFYPPSVNCTWILKAPPAHVINMRFVNFNTEEKFDFVTIYSSETRANGTGLFQFSGTLTEEWETVTPDNSLILDFVSDEFTTYEGFQLAYRYMPKACVPGGVVLKESQLIAVPPWNLQGVLPGPPRPDFKPMVIQSDAHHGVTSKELMPNWVHVSNYPQGLNCTWQFSVDTRDIIEINFLRFHTSPSDFIQIWKVQGDKVVPFKKFWEGKQPDSKIISSSPLVMNFVSAYGEENMEAGFLLNVTYSTRACSKEQNEISSPRGFLSYPKGNFEGNVWETFNPIHYGPDNCSWTILAPEGYVINITIQELDTRPEDQFHVTDSNKQIIQFGGSTSNKRSLISDSNKVWITFTSLTESENSGFLLYYSWVLNECKYQLSADGGEIRSPYYPDTYGSDLHCQWTLAPTPKRHMVHFVTLRLQMDAGDFLQMSDGKENILLTSESQPMPMIEFSSTFPIVINFLSDSKLNRGYFYFKYTVFESGNCDFSLTTCGWKSLDPLHAWTLDEKNGAVFTQESDKMMLPRGYKSRLVSQILEPAGFDDEKPIVKTDMCLEFEYLIKGVDAYQLNVAIEKKKSGPNEVWNEYSSRIYEINGPHGDQFLWTAINFTVTGYFRVIFSYERGYGADYLVAIDSVQIKKGSCHGPRITDLSSFTCSFNESFCGWKNTHSDQCNWLLRNEGITAMGNGTLTSTSSFYLAKGKYISQVADLISPMVVSADLFKSEKSVASLEDYCIRFNYQIFSTLASLKVLVAPARRNSAADEENILWRVGKFSSGRMMAAEIPLRRNLIPDEFKVILRALSSKQPKFILNRDVTEQNGALLKNIRMDPGKCSGMDECTFDDGFCSWKTISSGRAAWHIKEENANSFAAVSDSNGRDLAALVSPPLISDKIHSINFRYKINSLEKQCLRMSIKKDIKFDITDLNVSKTLVLWEQCKDKGNSWLYECVDLPIMKDYSQIVISVKFAEHFVHSPIVWLDDLRIMAEECYPGKDFPKWNCLPEDSLCGLTQSSSGSWKWIFVENKEKTVEKSITSGFSCLNGNLIVSSAVCNGYPDCNTGEDEINCPYMDYVQSDAMFGHDQLNSTDSVTCADGEELNSSWLCDGIQDCRDGSDEINCGCVGAKCDMKTNQPQRTDSCDSNHFRCFSGARCYDNNCVHDFCIEDRFVCDGIDHCNSREDENECLMQPTYHSEGPSGGNTDRMECSGGLFLPKSFRCDGIKDCPLDGKDEVGCHHCRENEFLCPTTGICLPWPAVCDGDSSIETCTDEDYCQSCPMGYFACDTCVNSQQVCDGVWDCIDGEDELRCNENSLTSMPMADSPMTGYHPKQLLKHCNIDQYQCSSGSCIPVQSLCNRIADCEEGDDEFSCPEDNFEIIRYISAKTDLRHAQDHSASYLMTPILSITAKNWGILSFQYRLDSWIGPTNFTLSIEMVNNFGNESLLPFSLWRQSGHKGETWIREEIIVPVMETTYRLSFVMAGTGIRHHSEKNHLSNLSFKQVGLEDIQKLEEKRSICNFDHSWCGWNQATVQNGYTWIHTSTSPHSRRTGPLTGYSGGQNSGFLLADSLHGKAGDSVDLISPALQLSNETQRLCVRVMAFLYGSNVAGLSFHTQQRFAGHIFSNELFNITGAQGLNWIPVTIDISNEDLSDPNEPFFVAIRATRGNGPESDVAIDRVELSSGNCANGSSDPIFFKSLSKHTDMYIIKAGSPSKPYVNQKKILEDNSTNAFEEFCSSYKACSTCVSSKTIECSWCADGHFCIWQNSPRARICSNSILSSSKNTSIPGPSLCPRIIKDKNHPIYVPNHSNPILSFSVENIQKYHTSEWICRYSIPIGQTLNPGSPEIEEEIAFLREFKSDDVDSEFWNLLKGFASEENQPKYEEIDVKGFFQITHEANNTGIITCGNGQTGVSLPKGESVVPVNISIITPLGYELDNPDSVKVIIYSCESLAPNCETCVSLNTSFDCGWCSVSHKCLRSTDCLRGRWHSHQAKSVCKIRDELDILTELLSDSDLETDFEDPMMDAEDGEFYKVSNVKKKVGKNLRKSLQSKKDRHSKVEQVENFKNKKRNKDNKSKYEKRKSDENRKRERGSRKGRKKSFLKVPFDSSVYIARNMWRLHTGKQYYIPVIKKTMLNLGFVRQVNYGDLKKEKPRTLLIDGKWKKAVGFFVDLFENADDDPVTSIVTTKKEIFDQLLAQL